MTKCKNCGHEIEKRTDGFESWFEHLNRCHCGAYGYDRKCLCGCVNPEPEKEAKK